MRIRFFVVLAVVFMMSTGAWATSPSSLTAPVKDTNGVSNFKSDMTTEDAGGPPYYVPAGWDVDGLCVSSQSGYPELYHYWGQFDSAIVPAYSGTYHAGCWWSDGNGEPVATAGEADEWLISPSIDCTGTSNLNLAFWSAYTVASYGSAATAHNYVQVSIDGGATWAPVADLCHDVAYEYAGTGNNTIFGTPPNGWNGYEVRVNISLAAYNGEPDVMFAFNYVSTDGAAPRGIWMVDDVELRDGLTTLLLEDMDGTWVIDPDYVAANPPTDLACVDNGTDIDLTWTNNDTYDSIDVYENGVLIDTLAGSATSYNIADPTKGTLCYWVCAWVGADEWCSDLCCLFFGYDNDNLLWDFDGDDGGAVIDGTGGWEWGAPTFGDCAVGASGNVWATDLDANYANSACWVLDSAPINIPDDKGAFICFDHCYDIEAGYDGGTVWFTTDDYWYYLWSPVDGWDEINSGTVGACSWVDGRPVFSGVSGGWVTDCWDFTDPQWYGEDVRIRWAFASDSSVAFSGWMIDNVTLYDNGDGGLYSCDYVITPNVGTLPFAINHTVTITNNLVGGPILTRKIDARINVTTGNGNFYSNWRGGQTNIAPGVSFTSGWNTNLPATAVVLGTNTFTMFTMDISPPPYNQPPNPPSGTTCTVSQQVVANAP